MTHFSKELLLLSLVLISWAVAPAIGSESGYVATFSPDGSLLSWFDAGMIGSQRIESVDVDGSGNIWVGRMDNTHASFPTPNDKIVKYSALGVELLTIKGPMSQPQGVAFDAAGNIYAIGVFDATDDTAIFKFDESGSFQYSFGTSTTPRPYMWQDLIVTDEGRLFAAGSQPGVLAEFGTDGSFIAARDFGAAKNAWGFVADGDPTLLHVLEFRSGAGEAISTYDTSFNQLATVDFLGVDPPWDNLLDDSLAMSAAGNLLVGASSYGAYEIPVVHELTIDGALIQTLQFPEIASIVGTDDTRLDVQAFAVDANGNYIFGFNTVVPEPLSLIPWLGFVCAAAAMTFRRR